MDKTPVVIDDDDVVVVDSDEIIDIDSKDDTEKPADILVLDDESTEHKIKDKNGLSTVSESSENVEDSDKEKSFRILLKNNILMSKIVNKSLSMANNTGMPRVVHKTLVPLYKDAANTFKQSEIFSNILNKVLTNLRKDPDHKFLHIKTLCDELKAGQYKRKVPFVTLTTDVPKSPKRNCEDKSKENLKTIHKDINKNDNVKSNYVIYLDDSDNESNISVTGDQTDQNNQLTVADDDEIVIIDDTHKSIEGNEQVIKENSNDTVNIQVDGDVEMEIVHKEIKKQARNVQREVETAQNEVETINKDTDRVQKQAKRIDIEVEKQVEPVQKQVETQQSNVEINNSNETDPDCDLLVPQNSVPVQKHSRDSNKALLIEKQIAFYKTQIRTMEEMEVVDDCSESPYVQCHVFKRNILCLYKTLCKLTGNGDGDVTKQRVVRLRVVEGHPPGPTMRLERFLNNSIDETGSVPLPDFHDVMRCVTQSNIADQLGWSKRDIMREAIALFTFCGNALRKQRQKREYKDLMTLVREQEIDDDDPAAKDPVLQARLEENKLIAYANEQEVLERYVQMQYMPKNGALYKQQLEDINILKPGESSDTDTASESDITPKKKVKTKHVASNNNERESSVINNEIREASQPLSQSSQVDDVTSTVPNSLTQTMSSNSAIQPSNNSTVNTFIDTISHSVDNVETVNTENTKASSVNNNVSELNIIQKPQHLMLEISPDIIQNTMYNRNNPIDSRKNTINNIKVTHTGNVKEGKLHTRQAHSNIANTLDRSEKANTLKKTHVDFNTQQKVGVFNMNAITYNRDSADRNVPETNENITVELEQNTDINKNVSDNLESNTDLNKNTAVALEPNTEINEITTDTLEQNTEINENTAVELEQNVSSTVTLEQNTEINVNVDIKLESDIKKEPIDIQCLLDQLGDNYTATIFDIEDPFLVVEISDSSDDEDL